MLHGRIRDTSVSQCTAENPAERGFINLREVALDLLPRCLLRTLKETYSVVKVRDKCLSPTKLEFHTKKRALGCTAPGLFERLYVSVPIRWRILQTYRSPVDGHR